MGPISTHAHARATFLGLPAWIRGDPPNSGGGHHCGQGTFRDPYPDHPMGLVTLSADATKLGCPGPHIGAASDQLQCSVSSQSPFRKPKMDQADAKRRSVPGPHHPQGAASHGLPSSKWRQCLKSSGLGRHRQGRLVQEGQIGGPVGGINASIEFPKFYGQGINLIPEGLGCQPKFLNFGTRGWPGFMAGFRHQPAE